MQFLRAVLRQNFSSSLLVIIGQSTVQAATQPQPPSLQDAALHPLVPQQVFSLVASLQNLLVHVQLKVYKVRLLEQHQYWALSKYTNLRRNHSVAEPKELPVWVSFFPCCLHFPPLIDM